ncbi:MAG: sulfite exporter TauE/SafE family protein [Armatimonadetes bacterium]|nr:sulfite exporter TauE/SafE family protein [Armatimonadota bacterium]
MPSDLLLLPLGVLVGALGTLIGAGGGFILVPLLLLLKPGESPETITSVSLAVVFFNALSGSLAYARMRRIDYRSGLLFAAATVPGAIAGALATSRIPRRAFDILFGCLMIALSFLLVARPEPERGAAAPTGPGVVTRRIVDRDGRAHEFSFRPSVGVLFSLGAGFLSSLLGIGGGVIHVPALVHVLSFPVHIATATSQFVLLVMALVGTGVHVADGTLSQGAGQTGILAAGVIAGAQLGAVLSRRLNGARIVRTLGTALGLVGVRILIAALRV